MTTNVIFPTTWAWNGRLTHRTEDEDKECGMNSRPQTNEPRTVLPKDDARQAVTGHNVRYVLGAGLAAVIVAFAAIYIFYFGV
jgi:hypothetical protein